MQIKIKSISDHNDVTVLMKSDDVKYIEMMDGKSTKKGKETKRYTVYAGMSNNKLKLFDVHLNAKDDNYAPVVELFLQEVMLMLSAGVNKPDSEMDFLDINNYMYKLTKSDRYHAYESLLKEYFEVVKPPETKNENQKELNME